MNRRAARSSLLTSLLFGFGVGTLPAIALPNYRSMCMRAKRAEAPGNVDGIKTAMLAYLQAHDALPEYGPAPDVAVVGKVQRNWESGTSFDTLGWAPDGKVRGVYWYVLTPDRTDFVVYGVLDVDGDGDRSWFAATRNVDATQLTPNDVY